MRKCNQTVSYSHIVLFRVKHCNVKGLTSVHYVANT
jgi:hypothetical protein